MDFTRRLGGAYLALFYVAPLAWVACLGAFACAVTIEVGHFPSYSNPDPKHVAGLAPLYEATVLLFFLALLSPLVIGYPITADTSAGVSKSSGMPQMPVHCSKRPKRGSAVNTANGTASR